MPEMIIEHHPLPLKNGNPGKRYWRTEVRYYTKLHTCELCGKMSTPKKVHQRGDIYFPYEQWQKWEQFFPERILKPMRMEGSWGYGYYHTPYLCMSCWNSIAPIFRRIWDLYELSKLAKRLRRTRFEPEKKND